MNPQWIDICLRSSRLRFLLAKRPEAWETQETETNAGYESRQPIKAHVRIKEKKHSNFIRNQSAIVLVHCVPPGLATQPKGLERRFRIRDTFTRTLVNVSVRLNKNLMMSIQNWRCFHGKAEVCTVLLNELSKKLLKVCKILVVCMCAERIETFYSFTTGALAKFLSLWSVECGDNSHSLIFLGKRTVIVTIFEWAKDKQTFKCQDGR